MPFWKWYRGITSAYMLEFGSTHQALESHADLREIITTIRTNQTASKSCLILDYYVGKTTQGRPLPIEGDEIRAFDLATSILLFMNCLVDTGTFESLERGSATLIWTSQISIGRFVNGSVPSIRHPFFENDKRAEVQHSLAAKSLKKAGLRFEATNDLRNHLRLDAKEGIVYVFHQSAALKSSYMPPYLMLWP